MWVGYKAQNHLVVPGTAMGSHHTGGFAMRSHHTGKEKRMALEMPRCGRH